MQTVHNLIILDASGSMTSIYNQALNGLNETIQSIKISQKETPEIRQLITLASFSSGTDYLRHIFNAMPVEEVHELTTTDYTPYGGTALYDAIGTMVHHISCTLDGDTRVLVTIITDGEENSSHHFTGQQIKSLIDEYRRANWLFTYIGANQDVEAEAAKMGIHSTLNFCANEEGTQQMFAQERKSRRSFYRKLKQCFDAPVMSCEESYFKEE